MSRPAGLLFVFFVLYSACGGTVAAITAPVTDYPAYVYVYADGCWVERVWFDDCPYTPGSSEGYYYRHRGEWHRYRSYVWPRYFRLPPPRFWQKVPRIRDSIKILPPAQHQQR